MFACESTDLDVVPGALLEVIRQHVLMNELAFAAATKHYHRLLIGHCCMRFPHRNRDAFRHEHCQLACVGAQLQYLICAFSEVPLAIE